MIVNGVFPWTRNIAKAAGPLRWERIRARAARKAPKRPRIRLRHRRRPGYRHRDVRGIEDYCLLFVLNIFLVGFLVFLVRFLA